MSTDALLEYFSEQCTKNRVTVRLTGTPRLAMKISTVRDHVDNRKMALPEVERSDST